ncbi:hypothetical protein MVES1_002336 [Malassezia vespertilionis]|uniref:Large ribosomal subunit protein mL59 domain-containing protein n=1 Tax=Malassezia vespertilionis TaxID=2020962 RepID=A0A2N1JCC1_9BASI|nr:uncharacterized protein MVES1_002336 [Malassezia vespertilionis]PKI84188.1 hypothetical protein MVES_002203 [Malassezia vespertilionis]WFD06981.1 hypothetical protein MVES1_002336 [Malassezia vespertilionis]
MAFAPSSVLARGSASELVQGLLRWTTKARASAPKAFGAHDAPHTREDDAEKRTFRHWKRMASGRWNPPRYSARREAQLVHAAFQCGQLDAIAGSKKKDQLVQRLARQETHELFEPWPAVRMPRLAPADDAKEALRIAKKAHDAGPYAGRSSKRMFKGSAADRASHTRAQTVAENMRTMDDTVREWRQEKNLARAKAKPTSPL